MISANNQSIWSRIVHLGWFIQITPSYLVYMVEIVYILWMVNFTGSYRLAAKKKELQS